MTLAAYRRIFRIRPFRLFWIGFAFSVLGDALTRVAFTWYVYELTGSPEALGWLMLCYTGPVVVGGLLAGWLLDRFDCRTVMMADNVVRGAAIGLVPLLHVAGGLQVWHIYAIAAVYGTLMMIALAGAPALIPSLVPEELLATANALEMLAFTLGGVVGPVVAGVLIAWISVPYVVLIDVVSYLAFALLLTGIQHEDRQRPAAEERGQGHLGHAMLLLLRKPVLLSTTLMFLVFNIGGGILAVALPVLADRQLNGGPELYGILLGAIAAGEVVSALFVGGLAPMLPAGLRICIAQALSGAVLLLLVTGAGIWPTLAGLALFGAFSAPLTIWAQTLRMAIIPPALRGRTFALLRMLMQGGNPIGGSVGGLILAGLGLPAALLIAALFAGVPGIGGLGVPQVRHAGRVQEPVLPGHIVGHDVEPEGL